MEPITIAPTILVGGVGVLLLGLLLWRASARKARAAADAARAGARAVSLVGRVLVLGGLIVGVEWVVITYAFHNVTLVGVVLGLPALFTAYTLVRSLTIVGDGGSAPRGRGGKR